MASASLGQAEEAGWITVTILILDMGAPRGTLQNRLLTLLSFVLFYSGALRWINCFVNRFEPRRNADEQVVFPFVRKRTTKCIQIFVYHRVNEEGDPFFPAIPTKLFERQLTYLASQYSVIGLEEAVERMKHGDVPDNTVVITFDDGYRDNYLNAFPILKKLSLPATIFLATDAMDSRRVLWHDRVFSAFRETRQEVLEAIGQDKMRFQLGTLREKLEAQGEVLKVLRSLKEEERAECLGRLIEALQVEGKQEAEHLMLSWDEVRLMHEGGISYGSHTITHPILSQVSREQAIREIYDSKMTIEKQIGVPVRTFAYPSGRSTDYSQLTKQIVREAGYICAVTATFGTNREDQDLFELRRGNPWEKDLATFGVKLNWYKYVARG